MFTKNDLCTTFVGFKENIWKNKIWKSEKKWVTLDFIFLIDASKDLSMDEYKQMKISVGEFCTICRRKFNSIFCHPIWIWCWNSCPIKSENSWGNNLKIMLCFWQQKWWWFLKNYEKKKITHEYLHEKRTLSIIQRISILYFVSSFCFNSWTENEK